MTNSLHTYNAVTRDNDARAVAGFFTKEDLHNYMVSH